MQCSFCLKTEDSKKGENIEAILKSISTFGYYEHAVITGGEPFLDFDKLKKVISSLSLDSKKTINTNGRLLTPEIISWINANNIHIIISLQGITGEKSVEDAKIITDNQEWPQLLKTINSLSLSTIVLPNTKNLCNTLHQLRILFNTNIGLSLDVTQKFDDISLDWIKKELIALKTIDSTSTKWLTFTHTTKQCDYSDMIINADGSVEKLCEPVPGFPGCVGYRTAMSFEQYTEFLKFVDTFRRDPMEPSKLVLEYVLIASNPKLLNATMATKYKEIVFDCSDNFIDEHDFLSIIQTVKIQQPMAKLSLIIDGYSITKSLVAFTNYHGISLIVNFDTLNGDTKSVKNAVIQSRNLDLVKELLTSTTKKIKKSISPNEHFSNDFLELFRIFMCPFQIDLQVTKATFDITAVIAIEMELKKLYPTYKNTIVFAAEGKENLFATRNDFDYYLDICKRFNKGLL
jgi:hypothetical protein